MFIVKADLRYLIPNQTNQIAPPYLSKSIRTGMAIIKLERPITVIAMRRVAPITVPNTCGNVARHPKLALEAMSSKLLGPGRKSIEQANAIKENATSIFTF